MSAYIVRRLLFMIPTLLGIMLVSFVVVQFAPGGPVERVPIPARALVSPAPARAAISAGAARRAARQSIPPPRSTAARRASIQNSSRSSKSSSASISRPTSASS
jgi:ABC-type microcin C transport system permease subunit YejB